MKKLVCALLLLNLTTLALSQTNSPSKIIEIAKIYHDFHFTTEPTKEDLKDLKSVVPGVSDKAAKFITQAITANNKLLTKPFLTLPDETTLKQLYMIGTLSQNLLEEEPIDNNHLLDSLTNQKIPRYELVDNYYDMMFLSVANKNKPFDLSAVNFMLKDYHLQDDTEKGILFLQCMDLCRMNIWGFMNVVNPPNTQKAYDGIKKFPRFNGQTYYRYADFNFQDFEMEIAKDKGKESYKGHYLNNYYETLLYHLLCLRKEGGTEEEHNDLLIGSILKEKKLYKYSKYKDTLEGLFKEYKQK